MPHSRSANHSLRVTTSFLVLGLCASLASAQNPVPMQVNVPYHCTDGSTVVVTCDTSNGPEVCFVNKSVNGQNFRQSFLGRSEPTDMVSKCLFPRGVPAGPPDPSIAKASAAHVDTKVLGIPLGELLQIKQCPSAFSDKTPDQVCVPADLVLDEVLNNHAKGKEYRVHIWARGDICPMWMPRRSALSRDCEADVFTYERLIVAVNIGTIGHSVDATVAQDLRVKYGPPTSVRPMTVTPRVGNPFKANDLEWILPGLHVMYDVAQKGETAGQITNAQAGSILIETEAAYQRRLAKENAKPKPTL